MLRELIHVPIRFTMEKEKVEYLRAEYKQYVARSGERRKRSRNICGNAVAAYRRTAAGGSAYDHNPRGFDAGAAGIDGDDVDFHGIFAYVGVEGLIR
jgi:hypothetical protein